MCLGCKIYGPEAIAHMYVSGSTYNSARDFSVSPGLMLRTCTKVELLGKMCTTDLTWADYFTNLAFVPTENGQIRDQSNTNTWVEI